MARISDEKRSEAARLLAEGRGAEWVASRLQITPGTVRRWRRVDPEFQALERSWLASVHGKGVLALIEQPERLPKLRRTPGATAVDRLRDATTELGRKEARRGR